MTRLALRTSLPALLICGAMPPAMAMPPPPPLPDVLAQIEADCRTPPGETIPLVKTVTGLPKAPVSLGLGWAIELAPPPGAHIGRVIGISRTWSGSILAATDRGYWIRVPSKQDESRAVPAGPVAVTIRDLPGRPT